MEKSRQAIIMLGLPASGKGTQAEILAKIIDAEIIGVGDLVREAIKSGDRKNPLIKNIINNYKKGIPQPDDIAKKLIEKKLLQSNKNIIFDNYPFSKQQLSDFEEIIKKYHLDLFRVIYIKVNPKSSIERISKRLICSRCNKVYLEGSSGDPCKTPNCSGVLEKRSDDTKKIISERIKFAQPRINLVLKHFEKNNKVYEIDGEKTISEVSEQIKNIL